MAKFALNFLYNQQVLDLYIQTRLQIYFVYNSCIDAIKLIQLDYIAKLTAYFSSVFADFFNNLANRLLINCC